MTNKKTLEFHTEKRKLKDLVPYELNPRKLSEQQQEHLLKSLEKFGLAEIPVIDLDNKICAGHQRISTMILMGKGDEEIDVRVPNRKLTDEEFNEYNIRSNKNSGDWDWDLLSDSEWFDNFESWGFTKEEINYMNEADNLDDIDTDPDEKKDSADTKIVVGGYRYKLTREQFAEWEEDIIQEVGFNRDEILNEILKRLKVNII
jgi:hypothetical protein